MRQLQLFLAGNWHDGSDRFEVRSPFDGSPVSEIARGGPAELEAAVDAADQIADTLAEQPAAERVAILGRAIHGLH